MSRNIILSVFVLTALAHLGVPGSMIIKHETALTEGNVYKFRCAPFDPYDAFRGRYVTLRFVENRAKADVDRDDPGGIGFAVIGAGEDGYARVVRFVFERPEEGDYIRTKYKYSMKGEVWVKWPFDKYFMEESSAPEAEKAYREHTRRGKSDAYVMLRVKDGNAVIEDLYVGGVPIKEYLEARKQETGSAEQGK